MKIRLVIWLVVELLVASGISVASRILRHDQGRAFLAWHNNPNAVTRAELDRQHRITFAHRVGLGGVLWAGMAGVTIPIVVRVSPKHSST